MNTKARPTVLEFLASDYACEVANGIGCRLDAFQADGGGRVAREFRGAYSVSEVKSLLREMEAMQRACDYWRGLTSNVNTTHEGTH